MKLKHDIVVTGLGAVAGPYANMAELVRGLFAPTTPRVAPLPVTRPEAMHPKQYPIFALPDDLAAALTPAGGTLSVGMALAAAREALAQAGVACGPGGFPCYGAAGLNPARIGVCLGASSGATLDFMDYYSARKSGRRADPARLRAVLTHNPAPALARRLGLNNAGLRPLCLATLTNACASGTDALGLAALWLRAGLVDLVLAGGTDELCQTAITGFNRLMVMDPEPCKPFDRDRGGLNLGEGAGVLVLERRDHAHRRGAKPLAVLCGYGTAADAYHLTAPHPEGRGLQTALREALKAAGLSADDLAFINAHGTGTAENDKAESFMFRTCYPQVPVSATKGATGHTLGAAGAIEAAITIACLLAETIPPSPGFANPHPDLGLAPVMTPTPIKTGHALSQSLAFGGNSSAVLFSRADEAPKRTRAAFTQAASPCVAAHAVLFPAPGGQRADTSALADFENPRALRRISHFCRLGLLAAHRCLAAAALPENERARLGLVIATGYGPTRTSFDYLDSILEFGPALASPTAFSTSVHNIAASVISLQLGLRGPVHTVSQGESSLAAALDLAANWIMSGLVHSVLLGALDEYDPDLAAILEAEALPRTPPADGALFLLLTVPTPGQNPAAQGQTLSSADLAALCRTEPDPQHATEHGAAPCADHPAGPVHRLAATLQQRLKHV